MAMIVETRAKAVKIEEGIQKIIDVRGRVWVKAGDSKDTGIYGINEGDKIAILGDEVEVGGQKLYFYEQVKKIG